jgi:hypothetical protein
MVFEITCSSNKFVIVMSQLVVPKPLARLVADPSQILDLFFDLRGRTLFACRLHVVCVHVVCMLHVAGHQKGSCRPAVLCIAWLRTLHFRRWIGLR